MLGDGSGRHTEADRGVPDPCAVDVQPQPALAREGRDGLNLCEGPDDTSASVHGVFERHEARAREVRVVVADEALDVAGPEEPAWGRDEADRAARDGGVATGFVIADVAVGVADDFVARLGLGADGEQVGHRAAGDEQGGLLAEHGRDAFLEGADGRVVAECVIAERGVVHGLTHGGRGAGDRVRTQIDDAHELRVGQEKRPAEADLEERRMNTRDSGAG